MTHREERNYAIDINLVDEFDDDYEGDEDGFSWLRRFETGLKPRLLAEVN